MENPTPPNTSGFDRKPKNRKRSRSRKSATGRKIFGKHDTCAGMPAEAKAWFFASMFLVEVAKALAPVMGFCKQTGRNSESATV